MRRALMAGILAVVAGCGGPPTFDATDDATVRDSTVRMAKPLPEPEKKAFLRAVLRESVRNKVRGGNAYRPLHGLTADQIVAREREHFGAIDEKIKAR